MIYKSPEELKIEAYHVSERILSDFKNGVTYSDAIDRIADYWLAIISQDRAAKVGCCDACKGEYVPKYDGVRCVSGDCPCHAPTGDAGGWEKELEDEFCVMLERSHRADGSVESSDYWAGKMIGFIRNIVSLEYAHGYADGLAAGGAAVGRAGHEETARNHEREELIREVEGMKKEYPSNDFEDGGDDEYRSRREAIDSRTTHSFNNALSAVIGIIKKRQCHRVAAPPSVRDVMAGRG